MSNTMPSVLQARNHAWQHWSADGLNLITQGFALMLFGLSYMADHGSFTTVLLIFLSLVIQLDQIFFRKIPDWLKARISYPRTGYVTPPQINARSLRAVLIAPADMKQLRKTRWIALRAVIAVGTIMTPLVYGLLSGHRWVLVPGIVAIVLLALYCDKHRKLPWYVFIPLLLAAPLLTFLHTDWRARFGIFMIALSITLILFGVVALSRYLKEHPVLHA